MIAFLGLIAAAVTTTAPVAPSGKWIVNYDKELCFAARAYGSGADAFTLAFRPFPTQPSMDVVILDHKSVSNIETTGADRILLDDGGAPIPTSWKSFGVGSGQRIVHIDLKRETLTRMAASPTLTFEVGKRRIAVQVPSMKAALAALATCENSLIRSWGIDPALFDDGASKPDPKGGSVARWFLPSDYPMSAMKAGQQGRVVALVSIDATGKVTQCRVVESSKVPALDDVTCANFRTRARYDPALSPDGRAVASWSLVPVQWRLP